MSSLASGKDAIFEWCGRSILTAAGAELAQQARGHQLGEDGELHRGIFSAVYMSPQAAMSRGRVPVQWVPQHLMAQLYSMDPDAISLDVLEQVRTYDPRAGFLLLLMIKMAPGAGIDSTKFVM